LRANNFYIGFNQRICAAIFFSLDQDGSGELITILFIFLILSINFIYLSSIKLSYG